MIKRRRDLLALDWLHLDWSDFLHSIHVAVSWWQATWPTFHVSVHPENDKGWIDSLVQFRAFTRDRLELLSPEHRELLVGIEDEETNTYFFGNLHGAALATAAILNPSEYHAEVTVLDEARSIARGLGTKATPDEAIRPWEMIYNLHHFGPACASRLLLSERPDLYVLLNSRSKNGLEKVTGHKLPRQFTSTSGPKHYRQLIDIIQDTPWWNEPRPRQPLEAFLWESRAALLDIVAYDPTA